MSFTSDTLGKIWKKCDYLEERTKLKINYFIDNICFKNNGNAHHFHKKCKVIE